jgi:L-ascorbate metabolism protein UlaG (beta-lactamase superfamily)
LIGHATLLLETREAVLLVDPVLLDPFEGGAVSAASPPSGSLDLPGLRRHKTVSGRIWSVPKQSRS